MEVLILGSKEYPMGTSDDPIRSGGIEIYTQNFVDHLSPKVDGITIITRRFAGMPSYEGSGNVKVHRVGWLRGTYLRNPSFNLNALVKALFLDYDIIISQGPVSSFLGGVLATIKRKRLISRPAGVSWVQPQYGYVLKRLLSLFERMAFRMAEVVVFLSEAERDQFKRKLGYLPKNHVIIPTGVNKPNVSNEEFEKVRKEFSLGDHTVVNIGRLVGVKGIDVLIEAINGIKTPLRTLIVGDGPDREKLQQLVDSYGLQERVIFAGWRDDIAAILAASDIFALTSYSEGLPVALLEAMISGKACIVTDIGLPVEHGKDAIVVPPGDHEELRRAIERLLEDNDLRKDLGKNAKEKALKDFTWEAAVEKYLNLFNQAP